MEIGCHLPTTQGPATAREALVTFAREAEARGIASLWVSDHVVIPRVTSGYGRGGAFPHPPEKPYLDPLAMLAAAAMCTSRARLGSSVFILGHRHPIPMAKALSTIDALSNGRLIVGVGVGWWKEELEILGVPYHARGRQADEVLRVFKALWTEENPSFSGEFFRFSNIGFAPKPVQKPGPPIWVGGDSPGPFARVVTLGDGWHATSKTPGELKEALAKLRVAAETVRRPFESIELSLRYALTDALVAEGPQPVVDVLGEYKRLGLSHVLIDFRRDDLGRMLELLHLVPGTLPPPVNRA